MKDLIIIGGGPSALSAAIYTTREDIDTTIYEKAVVGGMAAITDQIDNYPGFPEGVMGMKFAQDLEAQAERFGTKIEYGEVSSLKKTDSGIELIVDGKPELAKAVLIATGSEYRKIGIPGEAEYYGKGIHYCATCDGAYYRDKTLAVIGGGNSALQETIYLTRFASHIDLIVRSKIRASDVLQKQLQPYIDSGKVTVHLAAVPQEMIVKDDKIAGVLVLQNGQSKQILSDGVFEFIGLIPNSGFLKDSGVELDQEGFIKANERLETNLEGVFVSGDVRSGATMQVASAVGEGAVAALSIREYLEKTKQ